MRFPSATHPVLLCRTEAQAREALWRVGVILSRLKLTLHPTKTQVVYVGDGRQGFDFLGFHCRKAESWKYREKRHLQRWPGRRAMQRIGDKIKAITAPRHRLPEPVGPIVGSQPNQALRHWSAYFRVGNSTRKFHQLDDYVRERLALFLSKEDGTAGPHRALYNGGVLPEVGRMHVVVNRQVVHGSEVVKDLGKPCAREAHAWFDERGLETGHGLGPQRLQPDARTAPDQTATAPVLDSTPPSLRRVLPNAEHQRHKALNNRAENSHQPTRQRERVMRRFKSPEQV